MRSQLISDLESNYNLNNLIEHYKVHTILPILARKYSNILGMRYGVYIKKLTPYLSNVTLGERLFHIINGLDSQCKCVVCNNIAKFKKVDIGYSKYCSNKCISKDPEVKEKKKNKCIFSDKEKMSEIRETYKQRYGGSLGNTIQSCQKRKNTYRQKYGYDNPSYNVDIINKRKQTSIKNRGTTSNLNNLECIAEIRNTWKEKYGTDNPSKANEIIDKIKSKQKISFINKLLNSDRLKSHYIPLFDLDEYNGVKYTNKYPWKCIKCNTEFKDTLDNGKLPRCPKCFPYGNFSNIENRLFQEISTIVPDSLQGLFNIIPPYQLDVYCPKEMVGIELNGLYWYSELNKHNRDYYLIKSVECWKNNINLIHIFEDELINKKDIIKSIIYHVLGKTEYTFYARHLIPKHITQSEADTFLLNNHIQGPINGRHYGLVCKTTDNIVSLMSVGTPRFNHDCDLEIYRFCNHIYSNIPGALSKLLKYVISIENPKTILSYVDLRYGTGRGYKKIGFNYIGFSKPNYYYTKDYKTRINRMQFQKHKLQNKLSYFDPSLTEWENMQLNGYDRIWDCGNAIYTLTI